MWLRERERERNVTENSKNKLQGEEATFNN